MSVVAPLLSGGNVRHRNGTAWPMRIMVSLQGKPLGFAFCYPACMDCLLVRLGLLVFYVGKSFKHDTLLCRL
jgi:hypothetical protein